MEPNLNKYYSLELAGISGYKTLNIN